MDAQMYAKGDDVMVVMLQGHINSSSVAELEKKLRLSLASGDVEHLIVDCGKLQSISSIGLSMLLRMQSHLKKRGGDVRLANVSNMVAGVLRVVNLDKVLGIYPNINEACAGINTN